MRELVASLRLKKALGTGGDLPTLAATVSGARFPALLDAPGPAGAPTVGGGTAVGSTLSCQGGS